MSPDVVERSLVAAFFVPGLPLPEPRPRATSINGRAHVYKPATARDWKALVRLSAAQVMLGAPLAGPLRVGLTFRFPRPAGHFGTGRNATRLRSTAPAWPVGNRSDIDNLAKGVLDAMSGVVFLDDRQVVELDARKLYTRSEAPGVAVGVSLLALSEAWREA